MLQMAPLLGRDDFIVIDEEDGIILCFVIIVVFQSAQSDKATVAKKNRDLAFTIS
jgi:hypothetical protein